MISLRKAHSTVRSDSAELTDLWNEVRRQWRDETTIQFQKEHWRPGEQIIDDYLRALDRLTDILERAEQDI